MSTKSKFKGFVACTKDQFDELTAKNSDKIYLITDDNQEESSSAATALYMHILHFTEFDSASNRVFIGYTLVLSRDSTKITDLAGIKAVLGENFSYPCWAYYEDTDIIFMSMNKNVFFSTRETTTKPWGSINISDVVMAI